jgi:predicted alpha/beta hydrolase family esterase
MGKAKKDRTPLVLKIVRWVFPRLEKFAPPLARRYFLRIFFTPLSYPVPEKELLAQSFAKKFTLAAAGKTIQGYEWGDAKPYVLLIHGWAGRATQLRRFIKPLMNAGFRVIGIDGPAHGNSSGKQTDITEFEQTFHALFGRCGEPEAVIAHSFGGVAALYAAMNGAPIRKLINIASPSIGDEVIKTYLKAVNGSPETGKFFKEYILKTKGKPFDEFSSLHFVKHLPHPVDLLIVQDENDKEVEMKHAEALMKVYPNANLIRTKKLGHTRILKDDTVIRRCVTFVRDRRQETERWEGVG